MNSNGIIDPVDQAAFAVLIGRFQPFHHGHDALLQRALDTAPQVLIVLGSAWQARSAKNPFNWRERAAMIAASLAPVDRARVTFIPLRDYYDDVRWAAALRRAVDEAVLAQHGQEVQGRRGSQSSQVNSQEQIALVGHFKDDSSYYLNHFPKWVLIAAENAGGINATALRSALYDAAKVSVANEAHQVTELVESTNAARVLVSLENLLPAAVYEVLQAWLTSPEYAALALEHRQLTDYKAAWSVAPYPPIFSTVDALVTAAGHILLIRRGGFPGKGQWALPGGFVEPRERLLHSAVRELAEETGLAVEVPTLLAGLREVKVFDHPSRSQRGRTITHVHHFALAGDVLPGIQAADDAAAAAWLPIAQLVSMEEAFFEDHFHILDCFLRLLPA